MARFDLPPDHYETLANNVANLKLENIDRLVKAELGLGSQVFGAFGPTGAVASALGASKEASGH